MNHIDHHLTNEDYHAGEGLSASRIKTAAMKTPLHMTAPHKPETLAMKIGTMAHAATFEPELFLQTYAIFEGDRRTKAGKAEWEEIVMSDLIPVTNEQYEQAEGIASAVHSMPDIWDLISHKSTVAEASGFYEDQGVLCKFRPDAWQQDDGIILDLKTCQDASPSGFAKNVANFGYHIQAAHYIAGAEQLLEKDHRFIFIAVEKEPPYAAAIYELDEATLLEGLAMRNLGIQAIKHAAETGIYEGYTSALQTIQIPRWAFRATDPEMIYDY